MHYQILGPLRMTRDGDEIPLNARKLEIVLATVLIRANKIVPSAQLLLELWGEEPPRRASDGLYVYVSQLRKLIRQPGNSSGPILTRTRGYQLRLERGALDLHVFEESMREARRQLAAGSPEQAVASLETALALWRGPVLGGLPGGPVIEGFVAWLEECRLECLELLVEARLELGQYRENISLLFSLIEDHPLREAFYRLLMLALYRADRQADALRVYQRARDVVIGELGLEPCRALRDLHSAILTDDHELSRRPALQHAVPVHGGGHPAGPPGGGHSTGHPLGHSVPHRVQIGG